MRHPSPRGLENRVRGIWQVGQAISVPRMQKPPCDIFTDHFIIDFNVCGMDLGPILHNSKSVAWNNAAMQYGSSRCYSLHPVLHWNHYWLPVIVKCPSFGAERYCFSNSGCWSKSSSSSWLIYTLPSVKSQFMLQDAILSPLLGHSWHPPRVPSRTLLALFVSWA